MILLDAHSPSPFDGIWDAAFSRFETMQRFGDLRKRMERLHIKHGVFVPPGYSNFLLASIQSRVPANPKDQCSQYPSKIIQGFSKFILSSYFGSHQNLWKKEDGVVTITLAWPHSLRTCEKLIPRRTEMKPGLFVLRHNYAGEAKVIGRQIDNEMELLDALTFHQIDWLKSKEGRLRIFQTKELSFERNSTKYQLKVVDFAAMDFKAQIQAVAKSDLFIGFHGAGLSHAIWPAV